MPKLLLSLVAALAVGGSAAGGVVYLASRGGAEEELRPAQALEPTSGLPAAEVTTPQSLSASPSAQGQLWRWGNVAIVIPPDPHLFVFTSGLPPDGAGLGLEILRDTEPGDNVKSSVLVDADTGAIVRDEVLPEDQAVMDAVLQSITVGSLDRRIAPWPYENALPADAVRETAADVSFIRPVPASGIHVYGGLGDPGGYFVGITNGRSTLVIDAELNGGVFSADFTHVLPEDREAFERWVSQIKVCAVDVKC